MSTILSIIITISIICLTLLVFAFTPFLHSKIRKYFSIGVGIFLIIMVFMPSTLLTNTHLPIINSTINEFTNDFLNKTKIYQDISNYDASLTTNIVNLVNGIVKMSFVYVLLAIILFIANIIFYVIHLIKSRKKMFVTTASFIFVMIMSIVYAMVPVYSIANLNCQINRTFVKKNSSIIEQYPEYKKYKNIFSTLDKTSEILLLQGLSEEDLFLTFTELFSNGDYSSLVNEIDTVNKIMNLMTSTGIDVIYLDENFDFSKTTKTTFDFNKIKEIIAISNDSKIYNNVARLYANDILKAFENNIVNNSKKDKISLQMDEKEFRNQYSQLLDLLKFVADYNLVNRIANLSISSVIQLVDTLDSSALSMLVNLGKYDIISKVKDYLEINNLVAALYTCLVLYDSMNDWLKEYKETDLYQSAGKFLEIKGVIKYE